MSKLTITLEMSMTVPQAEFWCRHCGQNFMASALAIIKDDATCPHCGWTNSRPYVSSLVPVEVSSLSLPVSDRHKYSALVKVLFGV